MRNSAKVLLALGVLFLSMIFSPNNNLEQRRLGFVECSNTCDNCSSMGDFGTESFNNCMAYIQQCLNDCMSAPDIGECSSKCRETSLQCSDKMRQDSTKYRLCMMAYKDCMQNCKSAERI